MNPFFHLIPFLETKIEDENSFDKYISHPLEIEVRKIIRENNSLTYFSEEERFPNIEYIKKTLTSWNINYKESDLLIIVWILGFTYLLIPLSFKENSKTLRDYHFLDSTSQILKNTENYFWNKINSLYREIYDKSFSIENLNSLILIDPVLYPFKNQKEYLLYIAARNYQTIRDYKNKFENNLNFFSYEEILKRKKIAIETLKKKYSFLYSENQKNEVKEIEKTKRAVDDPKWKQIENSPRIEWDMVLKTFGTNMVIRILLRRQDYLFLKKMIEENKITTYEDLNYILECMKKIIEHNDLKKEKEKDFEELKKFINSKLKLFN